MPINNTKCCTWYPTELFWWIFSSPNRVCTCVNIVPWLCHETLENDCLPADSNDVVRARHGEGTEPMENCQSWCDEIDLIVNYIPVDGAKGFNCKTVCDAFGDNLFLWVSQICELIHIGIHATWGMVVDSNDEGIRVKWRHETWLNASWWCYAEHEPLHFIFYLESFWKRKTLWMLLLPMQDAWDVTINQWSTTRSVQCEQHNHMPLNPYYKMMGVPWCCAPRAWALRR